MDKKLESYGYRVNDCTTKIQRLEWVLKGIVDNAKNGRYTPIIEPKDSYFAQIHKTAEACLDAEKSINDLLTSNRGVPKCKNAVETSERMWKDKYPDKTERYIHYLKDKEGQIAILIACGRDQNRQ
eukprot:TRINITY_DN582_c0_g1_i7.p1 TRINITY_DN582_c0_g1~~TRINITY_DN582_c0_g1_i7.p1  ORF type:complete len:126 (+),score=41.37 TRINITY_DN582_c0_g1_i7:241-618(+)